MNGLYVLDSKDKTICNLNTKRARLNDLNPTFIWHCRLGHINEKLIKRLHNDGLLSIDLQFLEWRALVVSGMEITAKERYIKQLSVLFLTMNFDCYPVESHLIEKLSTYVTS